MRSSPTKSPDSKQDYIKAEELPQGLETVNESPTKMQHDRNPEMLRASALEGQLDDKTDPKCLGCFPVATGCCCGYVALRWAVITVAMIDITMGLASIGFIIMLAGELKGVTLVTIKIVINLAALIIALVAVIKVFKSRSRPPILMMKVYFWSKVVEIFALPTLDVLGLVMLDQVAFFYDSEGTETAEDLDVDFQVGDGEHLITWYLWLLISIQFVYRIWASYLISSYHQRLTRGESLLTELGARKLDRMLDELKQEQDNKHWELEMTERSRNPYGSQQMDFNQSQSENGGQDDSAMGI